MDTFGDRLKKLRKEKEMTGEELGKVLNVEKTTISKYENNNRFPEQKILVEIANFFDVSLDYLLCRTDDKDTIIVKHNIDGKNIEVGVDKNVYPGGLSYEQAVDLINKLIEMGFVKPDEFKK